jgi:hypothetical protein
LIIKVINKAATRYSAFSILLLVILGCSKFETPTKQEYSKDDLTFAHFSNWKITEDKTTTEAVGEVRFITVEGPSDSIFLATCFPADVDTTLEDYANQIQQGMGETTKELTGGIEVVKVGEVKTGSVEAQIAGATRRGLRREFDIKALGIPVPHRADYYLIENDKEKWFIVAQAAQEDWDSVKIGFQTIFDTISIKPGAPKESPKLIASPTPAVKRK